MLESEWKQFEETEKKIGSQGASILAGIMMKNTSITELNLHGALITEIIMEQWIKKLIKWCTGCDIDDEGAAALGEMLKANSTLRKVEMWGKVFIISIVYFNSTTALRCRKPNWRWRNHCSQQSVGVEYDFNNNHFELWRTQCTFSALCIETWELLDW